MKDQLLDLVSHTHDLGCIDLIKIVGDENTTEIHGIADDRSIVLNASFNNTIADFNGTFGMPNLNNLKSILSTPIFDADSSITVKRQDREEATNVPVGLHFQTVNNDYSNDYRFMVTEVVNEKLKNVSFKGANWQVEFTPTEANIQKLRYQSQANPNEIIFQTKTEDGNLVFSFGDHSTHAGSFVFQADVDGILNSNWHWPLKAVQGILSLTGDKKMYISDSGAAKITVNSGLATYDYIILAQQK